MLIWIEHLSLQDWRVWIIVDAGNYSNPGSMKVDACFWWGRPGCPDRRRHRCLWWINFLMCLWAFALRLLDPEKNVFDGLLGTNRASKITLGLFGFNAFCWTVVYRRFDVHDSFGLMQICKQLTKNSWLLVASSWSPSGKSARRHSGTVSRSADLAARLAALSRACWTLSLSGMTLIRLDVLAWPPNPADNYTMRCMHALCFHFWGSRCMCIRKTACPRFQSFWCENMIFLGVFGGFSFTPKNSLSRPIMWFHGILTVLSRWFHASCFAKNMEKHRKNDETEAHSFHVTTTTEFIITSMICEDLVAIFSPFVQQCINLCAFGHQMCQVGYTSWLYS